MTLKRAGLLGFGAFAALGPSLARREFGPLPSRVTLIFDGS